jgi:heterodisulfide reductase subunit B
MDVPQSSIKVRSVVDVLANDVKIAEHIKKPLKGLKVACYYGCLLTRPEDLTGWDSPVFPMSMDNLAKDCGAEVVDFRSKTKCCGGPILVPQENVAYELTKNLLDEAKSLGADCIVLACPLCSTNLELRQPDIEKKYQVDYGLPILYITELIGLALGIKPRQLGLDKHIVSAQPVLAKLAK